ncbi:MAG TPA: hypothetical protein VL094_05205 [Sphingomonadaceae bacterium]|nr:hypothetical protein [Sphingomonadaceae bacterium]
MKSRTMLLSAIAASMFALPAMASATTTPAKPSAHPAAATTSTPAACKGLHGSKLKECVAKQAKPSSSH